MNTTERSEGYTGGMGGTPICIHVVMLKIPESTVNYFSDTLRGKFHYDVGAPFRGIIHYTVNTRIVKIKI